MGRLEGPSCFQEGSGWLQKAAPLIDPDWLCHNYATTMPQRSHSSPTLGSKTALGEGIRGGGRRIISLLVDSCDLTRPGHKARRIYIWAGVRGSGLPPPRGMVPSPLGGGGGPSSPPSPNPGTWREGRHGTQDPDICIYIYIYIYIYI